MVCPLPTCIPMAEASTMSLDRGRRFRGLLPPGPFFFLSCYRRCSRASTLAIKLSGLERGQHFGQHAVLAVALEIFEHEIHGNPVDFRLSGLPPLFLVAVDDLGQARLLAGR